MGRHILYVICLLGGLSPAQTPQMKYGVPVKAGPMDSVLLKDYEPESSVVVPQTRVEKARFPVIDVHTHDDMSEIKSPHDVVRWLKTLDDTGVATAVVFIDGTGDTFARKAKWFLAYPDRFQVWCGLETRDFDKPGYSTRAVAALEQCYRDGARGVGEISDKGWGIQDEKRPLGQRLHIDDPRLDPVWQKCATLHLPVNIHLADHPSCWRPLGPHQERTPDFQVFNLYGKPVPSYEELLAKRGRVLARNPKTTFIFCHLSNQGNDLAALRTDMDRYPNLYLDIAARDYELGRTPRAAALFLARYSDRVMFGTDMGADAEMYRGWWRLLETADEYIRGRLWWRQYGLDLPSPLLEKLYRKNAQRLLNWQRP